MKRLSIFIAFVLFGIFILVNGCTKKFDALNVNPNAATVVPATNILGSGIIAVANTQFSERLDIYYAGSYSGHLAAIGLGDYEYRVDINNSMWEGMYIAMTKLVDAANVANTKENNQTLYAAALTLKAYAAQKTTDMWGKIPYSQAFELNGKSVLYPVYDEQSAVYAAILAELKTAADIFKTATGSIGVGDFIFNGDVSKWRKFCNSVRLRVAIRMSIIDPATATSVIAEILGDPGSYPVMTANTDNAYFWYPGVTPYTELWYNRVGFTSGTYKDQYRMNDVLISTLKSNNDPRLPVYALPNTWGVYNGYKFGPTQISDTTNNGNNVSGIGTRFGNNPAGFSPFMNSAEVSFIQAEAYARNLVPGNAQAAYTNGINLSLSENGIAATDIANYLAQPEVSWNGGVTTNLQKIYIQKWISLFKQSVEAWSEARRTDVPLMTNISSTSGYGLRHNRPPFRMAYADEEKSLNINFPTDVVETDIFWGTQMWWDTRTNIH